MMDLSHVRLVLWRSEWHYAESRAGDGGLPFDTICGREVPYNADVKPFKVTDDVCAQCRRARPLWSAP